MFITIKNSLGNLVAIISNNSIRNAIYSIVPNSGSVRSTMNSTQLTNLSQSAAQLVSTMPSIAGQLKFALTLTLALTLIACGGGGSSSDSSNPAVAVSNADGGGTDGGGTGGDGGGTGGGGNTGPDFVADRIFDDLLGGGGVASVSNSSDRTVTTVAKLEWTNPANVTRIVINRTTYAAATGNDNISAPTTVMEIDANDPANVNYTQAGRVNLAINSLDIGDIEDGQFHIFTITPIALPNATATPDQAEAMAPITSERMQLYFPIITGLTASTSINGRIITLSWSNPARVARVEVIADVYASASTDSILHRGSFIGGATNEGKVSLTISRASLSLLDDIHSRFSVRPIFSNNRVASATNPTSPLLRLVGSSSAERAPRVTTELTSPIVYGGVGNGFNVNVTAFKQDTSTGASVNFPQRVNSNDREGICIANLVTANATHSYPEDTLSSSVTVTYRVTFPSPDSRVCGDLTFTATENSKIGFSIYRDIDIDDDGLIEIINADELNSMRNDLAGIGPVTFASPGENSVGCPSNGCNGYELIANIDMGDLDQSWTPVGSFGNPFTGSFNGNEYEIVGLNIDTENSLSGVGLFGAASATSQLRNVHIQGARINAPNSNNVGALVGYANGAEISSSFAVVDKITAKDKVGGLVGDGSSAIISASSVTARGVTGSEDVGGLVGNGANAIISASYAHVDALVGSQQVGGLVGDGTSAEIARSLAGTDSITAEDQLGGLVGGASSSPVVTESYWDQGVRFSKPASVDTNDNGTAIETADLQTPTTFTGIYANWDDAYCNPATGEFSTTQDNNDFISAWDLGTDSAYPALNCLSDNPQEQHNTTQALVDLDAEVVLHIDYTSSGATLTTSGEEDWYRFTIAQPANINIFTEDVRNLRATSSDIDIVTLGYLYNSTDGTLAESPAVEREGGNVISPPSFNLETQLLPAGTYYMRIANGVSSTDGGSYTLRITREDNN